MKQPDPRDAQLSSALRALRADDAKRAPAFDKLTEARTRRPFRNIVWLAPSGLAAAAAIAFVVTNGVQAPQHEAAAVSPRPAAASAGTPSPAVAASLVPRPRPAQAMGNAHAALPLDFLLDVGASIPLTATVGTLRDLPSFDSNQGFFQ
jgi:hypothetical protein